MTKSFKINNIEYFIDKNPSTGRPTLQRTDGVHIDNRKEICKQFLRAHGWTNEQMKDKITNDLERKISSILNGNSITPSGLSNETKSPRINKEKIINSGKVILLNKPFLGGWLNKQGNIGHEIIDFLLADDGSYYAYNNPWGVCPDNIWIEGTKALVRNSKERYIGKYLVLTSEERGKDFDVLYVIELEEKLHRFHTSKHEDRSNFKKDQAVVIQMMRDRNILYNGKYLDEIYQEDDSLYLTFKAKRIYKAAEPILVTGLDYNFQRNKGYLYEDKNAEDYKLLEDLIITSITDGKLTEFTPRTVNQNNIGALNSNSTFLDLISLQDNEQVFTNILYSVLGFKDLLKRFCLAFKGDKFFDDSCSYKVFRETKAVDGRMDVCAEGNKQRVIIENKVYSGLNGIKPVNNKTQLSTYFVWGKNKEYDPLCFVVAPNFKMAEIKREIEKLDAGMKDIYEVRSYGDIATFIKQQCEEGIIDESYEFYSLIPQIINAFKNLSYSTKEDLYAKMFLNATN